MVDLDCGIVAKYPLDGSIDRLRDTLSDTERLFESTTFISFDGATATENDYGPYQRVLTKLLLAFMGQESTFNHPSPVSNQNIASELALIFGRVQNGDFTYEQYRPLIRLIIQKAPDVDIWTEILNLIKAVSRSTPIAPTLDFNETPIKSTSSSQAGNEQTRRLVEPRIFDEIKDCTFRGIEGFFSKYFEGKDWSDQAESICQTVLDSTWVDNFPSPPKQDKVLEWWFRFQSDLLSNTSGVYFTTTSKGNLVGSSAERQVDLLLKSRDAGSPRRKSHNWKDIRVVGELKESEQELKAKDTLLQIGRYVRDVFSAQPTRRFVHAFALCGTKMEAWVFDRSGAYSSSVLDLHKDSKQFFQVMIGYTMMSDEELGLDTFTEVGADGRKTIMVEGAESKEKIVLRLDNTPLCYQSAIVCRGTTCFLAKEDGDGTEDVAKFSWISDKRRSEVELHKLAHQRGVEGVAKVIGHYVITTIADMRRNLTFEKRYGFRSGPPSMAASQSSSQFAPSKQQTSRGTGNLSSKQSRPSRQRSLVQSQSTSQLVPPKKRASGNIETPTSKRSRSSSQRPKLKDDQTYAEQTETEQTLMINSNQKSSLFDQNDEELFDNRIFRCLVISPAGRPLYKNRSKIELLKALRDAIKAHRSLYLTGRILHKDISENNIIITDPERTGYSGMLIDLDLAKEIGSGRSGARHRTGTMEFMAIEVLLGTTHTYRHDLESFFYVLLWQCACRSWGWLNRLSERPVDSKLKRWYLGSYEDIADTKSGHMEIHVFDRFLKKEFPPELDNIKPLCRTIRRLLFSLGREGLSLGTPKDPSRLYSPIIEAYDATIAELELNPS